MKRHLLVVELGINKLEDFLKHIPAGTGTRQFFYAFDQTPISEPSALKYAFNCSCPFFSLGALTSTIIYGVILSFLYTIMSAALARISRPKWTLFSVSMRSNGYL